MNAADRGSEIGEVWLATFRKINPGRGAGVFCGLCLGALALSLMAGEPLPPKITNFQATGSDQSLQFAPYPSAQAYHILRATNVEGVYLADPGFALVPYPQYTTNGGIVRTNISYVWRTTNGVGPIGFYQVQVTPMESNTLFAAQVLNRLTYGPTPDEWERINQIGPEAYLQEQLRPWLLDESADEPDTASGIIGAKLPAADEIVTASHAQMKDLRAWHVLRAVGARRQLLEILLQFLENHFVTEYGKSHVYFGRYYNNTPNNGLRRQLATQLEYLENYKWRQALLNPECTFHDLLKISAESPAMIIYLDTVDSRGNGSRIANENYARELCELFCFGVDNGYDQQDIVEISKCWTGWRIDKVAPADAFDPFAAAVPGNKSTNEGVWAFNYKGNFHNTGVKTAFAGKTVPARFGPPWAGRSYERVMANDSTDGIQDGYQIIEHMADQPFTQEYLSIKLCRLLVHDNFPNPTTRTDLPEYAFYDYTRPDLSPEARLVHACMLTWETNRPQGQIWKVVETIVTSELFGSQAAVMQKVKTPLEYAVSAIRALRASKDGSNLEGTFTADTDGYSISGSSNNTDDSTTSPLVRMGTMMLFDRESPDGYPEDGPPWISAGTLAERTRFIQSFCIARGQSGHTGGATVNDAVNCVSDPVALLQTKLPEASWTNAPAVAAYFTGILYPAEGRGNLELYRRLAEEFLNTGDSGTPSLFSSLSPDNTPGSAYDTRVRGMVSLLMTLPRFHEQ